MSGVSSDLVIWLKIITCQHRVIPIWYVSSDVSLWPGRKHKETRSRHLGGGFTSTAHETAAFAEFRAWPCGEMALLGWIG